MRKKMIIPLLGLLASLMLSSIPITAAKNGWEEFHDEGTGHYASWTGVMTHSAKGVEKWSLTTATYPGQTVAYVTMEVVWHPKSQKGTVHCFTHYGYMLNFTNWRGTIKYDSTDDKYYLDVRGPGRGSIKLSGELYDGEVWGYYSGTWTPTDATNPMQSATSRSDWSATIRYH